MARPFDARGLAYYISREPFKIVGTFCTKLGDFFENSGPVLGGKIRGKCTKMYEKIDIFWARTSKRNFHRFLEDFGSHVGWIWDGFWEACCERPK